MDNNEVGVIQEQGDLGLGFQPLSDEELKVLEESQKEKDRAR